MAKLSGFLERKFDLKNKGTSVKTELVAGLTTFMAMVYILMVNAGMFTEIPNGPSYGAMYIVTAISAIVGTILIGWLSGLPLAQAPGMGLNAFFVYTICLGFKFSYANALVFVLLDGLVFIVLTLTGLREKIFKAIPENIKKAIPVGIGLFIAFIGAQNAKLVIPSVSTGVTMGSMNLLNSNVAWVQIIPLIVVIAGVIAIAAMAKKNINGAILWGVLGSTALYYALLGVSALFGDEACKAVFAGISFANPIEAFKEFGTMSFAKVFTEGFNFAPYIEANGVGNFILVLITSALAFCLVDMFDTLGTLYGACKSGNLLDEKGEVPNLNKAMLSDAVATCTGAVLGTSTVTTFVEASAGAAVGGKTALTSYVVAVLFAIAMFLSPIAQLVPSCATATALIYVGILMMKGVRDIEWNDPAIALPAFLTISMMPFTYNISFGIGLGLIAHVAIKIFTGKAKEVSVATYVLMLIFLLMFFFTH